MASTLAVSAASALIAAGLYAYVGRRIQERAVSREARVAQNLFVTWWYAIAASSAVTAVNLGLYLAGALRFWIYQLTSQVAILAISVALWGLLSYLVYLYTGSRRAHWYIGGGYILFYVLLQAAVAYYGPPDTISDNGWSLVALYEQPDGTMAEVQLSTPIIVAVLVVLIGPQFAAAVAYASLYRKATEPTQRYRIAMVAGSILVWFGTSIVGGSAGAEGTAWSIASQLLSIAAVSAILMAYFPPAPWRRRWGLRALGEEPAPASAA